MEKGKRFEHILDSKKVHQFVLGSYNIAKQFPKEKINSLTSPFRRASVSISAILIEGYQRIYTKEKFHFHRISQVTLIEYNYFLIH